MEKILVTGANGFIGSNLVKRLIDNGNTVRSMVRKTSDLKFLEGINTEIVYGDINDTDSLDKSVEGVDKVYHVAGLAADWGPYAKFNKINLQVLLPLLLSHD
jgi:dihydroflavonol-4-reductase